MNQQEENTEGEETSPQMNSFANSVLRQMKGGPHGKGDPDDKTLSLAENLSFIPAFKRNVIAQHYCSESDLKYSDCKEKYPWTVKVRCYSEFSSLKACLNKFWDLPEMTKLAEKEYLEERSLYRLTGKKKSERNKSIPSGYNINKN